MSTTRRSLLPPAMGTGARDAKAPRTNFGKGGMLEDVQMESPATVSPSTAASSTPSATRNGNGKKTGTGKGGNQHKLHISDPTFRQALQIIMKQVARNTQDLRLIRPTVVDTLHMRTDSVLLMAIAEEKAAYIARSKEAKQIRVDQVANEGEASMQPLAAMQVYQFLVFVDTLKGQQIGMANQRALET